jgi:protocatechuate 3,4-dioxygenase beta subunit
MTQMRLLLLCSLTPMALLAQSCPCELTSSDTPGPFYISDAPFTDRLAPEDELSDPGNVLIVNGTVYGDDCVPMANALVEPWYAGENNGYSVAGSSPQYRAQVFTDDCGNYEYTCTFPISYPGRPIRHIHYRVSDERELLVTQLYFEGYVIEGYNPDPSRIAAIETNQDGTRRVTFDLYVSGTGTANATACGVTPAPGPPTTSEPPTSPTSSASFSVYSLCTFLLICATSYL